MKVLLLIALAAYIIAAVHSVLAFMHKRRLLENLSLIALGLGFAAHTGGLILDWLHNGHYPLFGLRETLSFLAWTLVAVYGLTLLRYRTRALGSFISPVVVLFLLASMLVPDHHALESSLGPLDSAWIPVHTTLWIFAYASLFVVFVASLMYILQERELRQKTFGSMFHRLPSLAAMNEIAATATTIGFSLITAGIVSGILLSWSKTGRVWQNDPKEILAFLTWMLYFALVFYRASRSWRGARAAWMGIAGFGLVICTFLGARLMGGYHIFG
jgi:ABC-type uncharacterized transport system permease subunit